MGVVATGLWPVRLRDALKSGETTYKSMAITESRYRCSRLAVSRRFAARDDLPRTATQRRGYNGASNIVLMLESDVAGN
jgi:hypothetical protein